MGIFDKDDEEWKGPKNTFEDYFEWQVNLLIHQVIKINEFKSNIYQAIKEEREKMEIGQDAIINVVTVVINAIIVVINFIKKVKK